MTHPIMILEFLMDKIGLGHFATAYPHLVYSWLVAIILIVLARLATAKISMVPGALQNVFELIIGGLESFQYSIMGEKGRSYFPLMATLALFVFVCNIQGIIPGSYAPTSNINTTAALAIIIFLATHYTGLKHHGFGYIKHFLGPVPLMAPLMFPIEVISHLSRVLSLTLRLFGNVMGEDLVIAILFMLAGQFLIPMPMMAFGIFTGFLQAFIITLLAMIYISGALEEEH